MSWHGLFAVAERMGPERMLAAKSANPENATMKSIISGDSVIAAAYRDAEPRQFGTLHERMKWLIEAIQNGKSEISSDVREAVHELEAEIKHHVPAKPPFSKHT